MFAEFYLEGCEVAEAIERAWGKVPQENPDPVYRSVFVIKNLEGRPDPACMQALLPRNRRATREELLKAWKVCRKIVG
jgi:hypothetical protein